MKHRKGQDDERGYRWVIVAVTMLVLMLTIGTTMHSFGLYVIPVSRELALSRASVNTGLILVNAGAAVGALAVGRLIDRYPARWVMLGGGLILAASLAGLGLSRELWLSAAILSFPVGFAIAAMGTMTAPALVARWFTVNRARAMAITMMGISGGTVIVVPVIAWLIEGVGWRYCLVILGAFVALAMITLSSLVREPGSQQAGGRGEGSRIEQLQPRLSPREVFAMRRFWTIGVSVAAATAAIQSIVISLVPLAQDRGFSPAQAAGLISAMGGAGIAGKLVVAWAGDRFDRFVTLGALFGLVSLCCTTLLMGGGYEMLILASVFAGVSAGATIPVNLALVADEFGAESFGTVNGLMTFLTSILGAGAVRLSGEAFDRTGSYDVLFYLMLGCGIASVCLILTTGRYWSRRRSVAVPVEA